MDISTIKEYRIIVILRGYDTEDVLKIVDILYKAGIRLVEVTLNSPNALNSIKEISDKYREKIYVGAGTVLSTKEVTEAVANGANYIISPNVDEEVIKKTKELDAISLPGALTPSEIMLALDAGADMVKLFPASVFPISYIKEILAPLDDIELIPTGGINAENAKEYMEYGAVALGISSGIVPSHKTVDEEFLNMVSENAKKIIEIVEMGDDNENN